MRSLWLILSLALLGAAQLRADSVTLTTGEKVTGTIKNETPTDITIDVPVSDSITDQRVIKKTNISKIEKEQPDEIAYRQLIQVQPSAELSFSSQTYARILAQLAAFQTTYPNSTYLPEIKKLANTFQDEKKRVDAGGIKYLGQWLTADEAARRQLQIAGLETFNTMRQQAMAGDLISAMQTFDNIEHTYAGTRAYVAAVSLAQQVLPRLQQDLVVRMQQVKADQEQLKNTIAFTGEPEKTDLIARAKAEEDRSNAFIASAVSAGVKWVPFIPRSQVSVDTLQKTATSETQRLANAPIATMAASLAKVDAARVAIAAGEFTKADDLLKSASELWTLNEDAKYWAARLQEKVAAPSPTPVIAAAHATPKPLPTVPRPKLAVAAAATPVPAVEDKPYYMTISGAITIAIGVLVVGGIVAAVNKRKASKLAPE